LFGPPRSGLNSQKKRSTILSLDNFISEKSLDMINLSLADKKLVCHKTSKKRENKIVKK
jgi:hypothetical protein